MDAGGRNTEAHHLPLLTAYGGNPVADPRCRPLHGEQDSRTPKHQDDGGLCQDSGQEENRNDEPREQYVCVTN